jgi:hypothetical protein
MRPATVAETVTVTGQSPTVDITRSDVGTELTTQQIQELPVAARRWIDMALLTHRLRRRTRFGDNSTVAT